MTPVVLSSCARRLLTGIIFLFIPLSVMAPHGVVWEIIIAGLTGLYYSRKQPLADLPKPLTSLLLLIPLWGLVTAVWSTHPLSSLVMGLKILGLVVLGLYWCRLTLSLPKAIQKSFIHALIGGLLLGIFFLLIDVWSGHLWQTFWKKSSAKAFAQGSLLISLASWPTLLWILQRPYSLRLRLSLGICLLFSVFWTLLQIDCDTSFIGLFLGFCVFSGTFLLPRLASRGMRLFIPLFVICFPLISLHAFKPDYIPTYNAYIHSPSYLDRLYIWHDVATSIFEHPWRGIGMDGTHYHENTHVMRDWSYIDEKGKTHQHQTARFSMHPHNAILQLWLELGFIGMILGTLLTYQTLFHIYHSHLRLIEKAIGAGLFTGTFLVVWVSLGFWQNWWISGLWMIIGLTIMMFKGQKETNETVYHS
ncbi:MAG: O-antigen polymerase [Alphaproteobacteria bacterium]|jgi:O-antigen ligase|nr:O-antigen polymerase [Alphaproteobacteria bacterium]